MEVFVRGKNSARRALRRWSQEVENLAEPNKSLLKVYLEEGEKTYENLETCFSDILKTCDSAEIEEFETDRDECKTIFLKTKAKLLDLIDNASNDSVSSVNSSLSANLRLPEIKLPEFSGEQSEFMTFWNKFTTTVHDKPIPDAQKMEYLVSSLQGPPLRLISHLIISGANYQVARQLLTEKYENTRKTVFSLIQRLCEQPAVTRSTQLEQMLDVTTGIYHALETHGHPVEKGDSLFIYLMMEKLDERTRMEFKQRMGSNVPSAKEFLNFVKERVSTIDQSSDHLTAPAPTQNGYQPPRKPTFQPRIPTTTKQASQKPNFKSTTTQPQRQSQPPKPVSQNVNLCVICGDAHRIYSCEEFRKLTVDQRWQEARNHNLCGNCLQPYHQLRECKSLSSCRECGKRHHTLLHRKETACNNLSTQQ